MKRQYCIEGLLAVFVCFQLVQSQRNGLQAEDGEDPIDTYYEAQTASADRKPLRSKHKTGQSNNEKYMASLNDKNSDFLSDVNSLSNDKQMEPHSRVARQSGRRKSAKTKLGRGVEIQTTFPPVRRTAKPFPTKSGKSVPKGKGASPVTPKGKGANAVTPKGKGANAVTPKGKGANAVTPKGKGANAVTPKGKGASPVVQKGKGANEIAPAPMKGRGVGAKKDEEPPGKKKKKKAKKEMSKEDCEIYQYQAPVPIKCDKLRSKREIEAEASALAAAAAAAKAPPTTPAPNRPKSASVLITIIFEIGERGKKYVIDIVFKDKQETLDQYKSKNINAEQLACLQDLQTPSVTWVEVNSQWWTKIFGGAEFGYEAWYTVYAETSKGFEIYSKFSKEYADIDVEVQISDSSPQDSVFLLQFYWNGRVPVQPSDDTPLYTLVSLAFRAQGDPMVMLIDIYRDKGEGTVYRSKVSAMIKIIRKTNMVSVTYITSTASTSVKVDIEVEAYEFVLENNLVGITEEFTFICAFNPKHKSCNPTPPPPQIAACLITIIFHEDENKRKFILDIVFVDKNAVLEAVTKAKDKLKADQLAILKDVSRPHVTYVKLNSVLYKKIFGGAKFPYLEWVLAWEATSKGPGPAAKLSGDLKDIQLKETPSVISTGLLYIIQVFWNGEKPKGDDNSPLYTLIATMFPKEDTEPELMIIDVYDDTKPSSITSDCSKKIVDKDPGGSPVVKVTDLTPVPNVVSKINPTKFNFVEDPDLIGATELVSFKCAFNREIPECGGPVESLMVETPAMAPFSPEAQGLNSPQGYYNPGGLGQNSVGGVPGAPPGGYPSAGIQPGGQPVGPGGLGPNSPGGVPGAPQGGYPSAGVPPGGYNGGPTGGNNGGPPGGNNGGPPGGNVGKPPASNVGKPPAANVGKPPAGNVGKPPAGNVGKPPAGNNGAPPGANNGVPPGGYNGGQPGGIPPGGYNGGQPGGQPGIPPGGYNGGQPGMPPGGYPPGGAPPNGVETSEKPANSAVLITITYTEHKTRKYITDVSFVKKKDILDEIAQNPTDLTPEDLDLLNDPIMPIVIYVKLNSPEYNLIFTDKFNVEPWMKIYRTMVKTSVGMSDFWTYFDIEMVENVGDTPSGMLYMIRINWYPEDEVKPAIPIYTLVAIHFPPVNTKGKREMVIIDVYKDQAPAGTYFVRQQTVKAADKPPKVIVIEITVISTVLSRFKIEDYSFKYDPQSAKNKREITFKIAYTETRTLVDLNPANPAQAQGTYSPPPPGTGLRPAQTAYAPQVTSYRHNQPSQTVANYGTRYGQRVPSLHTYQYNYRPAGNTRVVYKVQASTRYKIKGSVTQVYQTGGGYYGGYYGGYNGGYYGGYNNGYYGGANTVVIVKGSKGNRVKGTVVQGYQPGVQVVKGKIVQGNVVPGGYYQVPQGYQGGQVVQNGYYYNGYAPQVYQGGQVVPGGYYQGQQQVYQQQQQVYQQQQQVYQQQQQVKQVSQTTVTQQQQQKSKPAAPAQKSTGSYGTRMWGLGSLAGGLGLGGGGFKFGFKASASAGSSVSGGKKG